MTAPTPVDPRPVDHRAVLLVGSAKPVGASSSERLAHVLEQCLQARGMETTTLHVARLSHHPEPLLEALARAELWVLASPLYVDALPYLVVKVLEQVAEHRMALAEPRPLRMAAIVNGGFPEAQHCAPALEIARLFARDARIAWSGGLALGGGVALSQSDDPELRGGMVRNVRTALELAADALVDGRPIPPRAVALMAKPMMPRFLYMLAGDWGWRRQARQHGLEPRELDARPFDEPEA